MINSLELRETNVSFSLRQITNSKGDIGENNTADSNCLRQIKPVVAVCMEITFDFIYRPRR